MREATCEACPNHTHSEEGSTAIADCVCNAGYTGLDGAECSACPAGTFKSFNGSSACLACATGKVSPAIGATSEQTCNVCPVNTYAADNSSLCITCPANSISHAGSSRVLDCVCNRGHYGSDGAPCSSCIAGSYKDVNGSAPCTSCPIGLGVKSSTELRVLVSEVQPATKSKGGKEGQDTKPDGFSRAGAQGTGAEQGCGWNTWRTR